MTKVGTDSRSRGRASVLLLELFCERFGTAMGARDIIGSGGEPLGGELDVGRQGPSPCPPEPWGKVGGGEGWCFSRDVVHRITLCAWSVPGSQRPSEGGRSIPRTSHPFLGLHLPRTVSSSNVGSVSMRRIDGSNTDRLWKAAEGAGGGVLPEGILENEPALSEADRDIIKGLEKD